MSTPTQKPPESRPSPTPSPSPGPTPRASGPRSALRGTTYSEGQAVVQPKSVLDRGAKRPLNLMPTMSDMLRMQDERDKPVADWLTANKSALTAALPADVVSRVRKEVKATAGWQDLEITAAIISWSNLNGVEVNGIRAHHESLLTAKTTRPKPKGSSTPPFIDDLMKDPIVKTLMTLLGPGYQIAGGAAGTLTISKDGLTAELAGGVKANVGPGGASVEAGNTKAKVSLGVTWSGAVTFKLNGRGFSLTTSVDDKQVKAGLAYNIGIIGPSIGDIRKATTEGETSLRNIMSAAMSVSSPEDLVNIVDAVKDDVDRVKRLFDTMKQVEAAKTKPSLNLRLGIDASAPLNADPTATDPTMRGPSIQAGAWLVLRL